MKKDGAQQFFEHLERLIGKNESAQLFESLKKPAPKAVRYNSNQCQANELQGNVVPWNSPYGRFRQDDVPPSQTLEYAVGKYYIQEAGAMLAISAAARTVDFSDKIVLDLCAAPGGKATQAAEIISNGYLVANEVIKKRVAPLTWNINRHRLNNVIITSLPTGFLAAALPGFFDIVIVDAPCSGEGLFQKKKHSPAQWSEKNVLACALRQKAILQDAVKTLRPGGCLVYSTCTFAKEENEDQVEYLLKSGLLPVPFPGALHISPAISGDKKITACSGRIFPHREGGTGGFVAILQKEMGLQSGEAPEFEHAKPGQPGIHSLNLRDAPGFFYEKKGIVSYFRGDKIPEILFRQAYQVGAPIIDRLRGDVLMYGAVQVPARAAVVELNRQQADLYISGKDLQLDLGDGYYFVSSQGMILGPLRVSSGKTLNTFPVPLIKH